MSFTRYDVSPDKTLASLKSKQKKLKKKSVSPPMPSKD
jgi:hypothetical protein